MNVLNFHPGLVKAWTDGVSFEEKAQEQVKNVARLPFIHKWVAIMPDVHAGIGATVGSVIPTYGAIIPAAVGVDIGCGMVAVETSLTASDLPDDLKTIRALIEHEVPHGRTDNGGDNDRGSWSTTPSPVQAVFADQLRRQYLELVAAHPKLAQKKFPDKMLGTLGTGNHFIEVCLDEQQHVWIMLHSGSRGPGNRVGTYFIEKAREDMRRWFINLPDEDLAYIPEGSSLFEDYVMALRWAQDFAATNRSLMLRATVRAIEAAIPKPFSLINTAINCHHNYVALENHYGKNVYVTRKGAVRARAGDMGIIPGSMGTRSYIVRGKGNAESFNSCSHGAGRCMSRTEAKKKFTVEDHVKATAGVECRKDADVVDETPMAYKDIDKVMEAQKDLVDVVHTLKQVLCVKG